MGRRDGVISSLLHTTTWTPTLGAVPSNGGAQFIVWAPDARAVDVVVAQPGLRVTRALSRTANGCFTGWVPDVTTGALYQFKVDGDGEYPDPASRFQPQGVHGPSMFVDASAFGWTDEGWNGISRAAVPCARGVASRLSRLARDQRDRADAGRRVGRLAQLGLRRRRPVRTVAS